MPPPPDLSERPLPLHTLLPGERLVRIHTLGREPLFFGPAPGATPNGRWDSADGRFGTCYLAAVQHPYIAFAERFLRDPRRTLVPEAEVRRAGISLIEIVDPIIVVPFHGASLKRLGASAAVPHGDHRESRPWARLFHEHPEAPAGIRWRSRIDDDGFALALFDRTRGALRVLDTEPLLEARGFDLVGCLERYAAAVVEE